jgi:hypothetical protein
MNTIESVKKDFNEFSDTVQQEVSALANASVKSAKHQAELFQQFVTTPDAPEEEKPKEEEKPEQENQVSRLETFVYFFCLEWRIWTGLGEVNG